MAHRIEFAFDIVSPYSYLAYHQMERYRAKWGVDVRYIPAFLGGVFAATRNSPPATLPARAPYLVRDLGRCGAYYDIPIMLPPNFPSKTVRALRVLTALSDDDDQAFNPALKAFFNRYWAKGEAWNDTEDDVIATLVSAGIGADKAAILAERATTDPVKDRLKAVTQDVVDRGAFGFPALFVTRDGETQADEEMYFGADRLAHIAHALDLTWNGPNP